MGVPGLPLSGALGVEQCASVSAPTIFTKFRVNVAQGINMVPRHTY